MEIKIVATSCVVTLNEIMHVKFLEQKNLDQSKAQKVLTVISERAYLGPWHFVHTQ